MSRGSDTREKLLEAAIELIWQRSYGSVSVDDICAEAGVKKGSFYHFFKSKQELVAASLEHHWATRVRPAMDRIFSPAIAPADRFRGYFEHVYQTQVELHARHKRVLGCPLCSIGSETSHDEPVIRETVQKIMSLYDAYWDSAIRDLLARQRRPAEELASVSGTLDAFMQGVMTRARIDNDPEVVRTLVDGGLRILGVSAPA